MSPISDKQRQALSLFLSDLSPGTQTQTRLNTERSSRDGSKPPRAGQPVQGGVDKDKLADKLADEMADKIADILANRTAEEMAAHMGVDDGDETDNGPMETEPTSIEPTSNEISGADDSESELEVDGVKRWVQNSPRQPRKITERKRADAAAFSVWLEKNQKQLNDYQPVGDQERSTAALVRGFESHNIIARPRDYQVELFERAKLQNTIAVLDTGSGKTLIAVLLLRWTIERELENRAVGKPRRISFFLVDKVALVFQQHAVLDCNLDYPAERFCGTMISDLWTQETWDDAFSKNDIIVCTAEILYKCLHHSYINMSQINLLIFDEAHHTKKKHPYARIIKDFYAEIENTDKAPRILGMTASPVDAQVDLHLAAAELEGLLHSRIVTTANPTDLQNTICKPKTESVTQYSRLLRPWKTDLLWALKPLLGENEVFRKALTYSELATSEMGPWCADRFWTLYLRVEDLPRFEAMTERNFLRFMVEGNEAEVAIGRVREAHKIIELHPLEPVTFENCDQGLVSSKVSKLLHILQEKFRTVDTASRCIVFVQQRMTAMTLVDLLDQPGLAIPGLRAGMLIGAGSKDEYNHKTVSFRDQVMTLVKFKKGDLNCLFATSVAEEGLDIPDCNLVIRYDLYNTMIQYIQSRGRARHENSEYIHMVEAGNGDHQRKMFQNKSNETALRRFCEALPEDRKLTGNDFDMEYHLRKEKGQRQYTVPGTGAKLTYSSALHCLAHFAAALPSPSDTLLAPAYTVTGAPGGFQCEVTMPEGSPVTSAMGRIHSTKQAAKCSAAFEICLALIKGEYLNDRLHPIYTKQLPAMRNAHLAISSKKKEEYEMRTKPDMWSDLGTPGRLYITVLALSKPEDLGWKSRPLLLLTRTPLPPISSFPLFFSKDRSSDAHCVSTSASIATSETRLEMLTTFTLRIFRDIFSKEYDATPDQLPYFVLPSREGHDFNYRATTNGEDLVDWEVVEYAQKTDLVEWTGNEPDDFFNNKYLIDPWDGGRKFFVGRRRHDLRPGDRVPQGIIPAAHRPWKTFGESERTILNWTVSLFIKARPRFKWVEDQPVFEAYQLWTRRNLLDDNLTDEDVQSQKCFIIVEPLKISALSADVVAMAYNLPAIIFKIESTLIALDACKVLDLSILPNLALEAVTKDSDNSEEHDVEQVNFQGGMGNNYERLEFLGDTFLKMATSISVFTLIPDKDEFEYHVQRMLLICNKNLFNNALEVKIQEYIRTKSLSRRTWYPEGLTLKKGKKTDKASLHTLGDKTIADVCEALIGAAYLTARKDGNFDMAVRAVTAMVKDGNHRMDSWSDYYTHYDKPDWQTAPATTVQEDMTRKVSARMGYTFKYPRLLRCAFMHPSYPSRSYEKLPNYQRLEFLGDSLIDMTCVEFLYRHYPGADPQWLTEHKMAMVSNQFLGCLSVSLGFNKLIVSFSSALQNEIVTYVTEITAALEEAQEEAVRSGKDRSEYQRNYWVNSPSPPKCLPDVVESYVGAMFVDSGYDFSVVQTFFDTYILPYFVDMRQYDSFARHHPVTRLAQLLQDKFLCNDWRLLVQELSASSAGADEDGQPGSRELFDLATGAKRVVGAVRVHGQTLAHGIASNGRQAKTTAARKALAEISNLELEEFRARFGCQCRLAGDDAATGKVDDVLHG